MRNHESSKEVMNVNQSKLNDFCGEGGIRTPGSVSRNTRFPGVPVKPLLHLSFQTPFFGKGPKIQKKQINQQLFADFTT